MPHRRRSSSPRRRRRWPALTVLGILVGCGPSAPRADADSTAPSAAAAAPADSASTAAEARRRAFADSAARLDTAFRRLRDSLDAASREMSGADRRSADYARRWDAFVLRERAAVSLRARRDSLRALAASR